jgi:hypothetical protein
MGLQRGEDTIKSQCAESATAQRRDDAQSTCAEAINRSIGAAHSGLADPDAGALFALASRLTGWGQIAAIASRLQFLKQSFFLGSLLTEWLLFIVDKEAYSPARFNLFSLETLMKKTLSLLAVVFALGLSTVAMDAEAARRFGGGKSLGMQRQATPPAKAPNAAPAQTPSATPGAAAAAPAAAAASNRSKWLGPIAGLAAGLGLAALASHLGFGEGLANMLMIGLLVMAAFAAFRFFMARRAASQGGGAAYAGAGAVLATQTATPSACRPRRQPAAALASTRVAP